MSNFPLKIIKVYYIDQTEMCECVFYFLAFNFNEFVVGVKLYILYIAEIYSFVFNFIQKVFELMHFSS